jgi:hypothetical protein
MHYVLEDSRGQHKNIAKVSISEAARLAGVSRSHLYAKFIKPGKISVQAVIDAQGKPQKWIDISELQRVFGSLSTRTGDTGNTGQARTGKDNVEDSESMGQDSREDMIAGAVLRERIRGLEALLRAKDEALALEQNERGRLLGIIERQTYLLEHQEPVQREDKQYIPKSAVVLAVVVVAIIIAWAVWPIKPASVPTPQTSPSAPSESWHPENGG